MKVLVIKVSVNQPEDLYIDGQRVLAKGEIP